MSEEKQAVFISYAWGQESDEREKIVNQLDQSLQRRGLTIVRDKRDLGYKGSIRKFMERIGEADCVIVVISDKYLRSKNCMYELVEIAENNQFADRIFPIILDDARIYDAGDRLAYVDHWERRKTELSEKIRGLRELSNLTGINEELNDYDRFRDEIDKLTTVLKDMNCLSPEMLREADFQQVYDALAQRMKKTPAATGGPAKKERKPMDPISLATATTALLAPYINKVGEKALDKIAEQLPEKVGALWNAISNRFKEKPAAAEAASDLAKNAADSDNQEMFSMQLKKALKEDPNFAVLLTDLLEAAKQETGISNVGDGVVATDGSIGNVFKTGGNISESTINISSNVQSNTNPSHSKK